MDDSSFPESVFFALLTRIRLNREFPVPDDPGTGRAGISARNGIPDPRCRMKGSVYLCPGKSAADGASVFGKKMDFRVFMPCNSPGSAGEQCHRSTAATALFISAVRLEPAKAPVVGSATV